MINDTKDRVVTSQGVTGTGEFGISMNDTAHIMQILRDQLYSDKVLAVLREYGANAWDAHRMVGKGNVPIKIVLPTVSDPSLTIRDFGPGLSKEDVFTIFTQYGASTKRNSNNAVGMLGIGSKSGFAYSDSFAVTSFHGGKKFSYVAVLDKTEKGIIDLLSEDECGEETGLMIQIAVRPKDIGEFEAKAKKLFKYFKPVPDINTEIQPLPPSQVELKKGVIYTGGNNRYYDEEKSWKAVMGCIPYRIDLDQLIDSTGKRLAPSTVWKMSGALFFDIGEVQISASREELKYSDATKASIITKFSDMIDEYVQQTIAGITSKTMNPWEQRVRLQILHALDLPVPKEWEEMGETYIDLDDKKVKMPKTFTITQHGRKEVSRISINEHTRLILKDDPRALEAFRLKGSDYLIRRVDGADWSVVLNDLHKFCEKIEIDGISIIHLASVEKDPFYKPSVPLDRLKGKTFLFAPKNSQIYSPYSPHWKPIVHVPGPGDVYVVIKKFKPTYYSFFRDWQRDCELAEAFGFQMPDIIGYRTTAKNIIDESALPGTDYEKWMTQKHAELHKHPKFLEFLKMSKEAHKYGGKGFGTANDKKAASLIERFGRKHAISEVISKRLKLTQYFKDLAKEKKLDRAFEILVGHRSQYNGIQTELMAIKDTYKLLDRGDPIGVILNSSHTGHWIKYINAVDKPTGREADE